MAQDNLGFDSDFMETMLSDFLDESQGYLANLNDHLLTLDQLFADLDSIESPNVDLGMLNEMFRDAHSLKGLSAMLQLKNVNSLTHNIENVLDAARDHKLNFSRELVDVLFDAFDRLSGMIEELRNTGRDAVEFETVVASMKGILERSGVQRDVLSKAEMAAAMGAADVTTTTAALSSPIVAPASAPVPTPEAEQRPFEGVEDESDIPQKYRAIFVDEATESLDHLSELLLASGDSVAVDPILVRCHQLKGSAASIGLNRAAKLAHLMEDRLQDLRDRKEQVCPETCEAFLAAVDVLREYVDALNLSQTANVDLTVAYQKLYAASRFTAAAAAQTGSGEVQIDSEPKRTATPQFSPTALTDAEREAAAALMVNRAAGQQLGEQCWLGCVTFESSLALKDVKALLVIKELQAAGELIYLSPPLEHLERVEHDHRLVFGLVGHVDAYTLRAKVNLQGIESITIEAGPTSQAATLVNEPLSNLPAAPSTPAAQLSESTAKVRPRKPSVELEKNSTAEDASDTASGGGEGNSPKKKSSETLRVDIDRLDQLMNLAGQLVISKARFGQITEVFKSLDTTKHAAARLASINSLIARFQSELEETLGGDVGPDTVMGGITDQLSQIQRDMVLACQELNQLSQIRGAVNELADAVHQLGRVSDGIQQSVMDTRMVPIGPLFNRFKRVIRDITRMTEKSIGLTIHGENTELDKKMIDELADPLIHMVRNAADHGIERPEDRRAAGKLEQGEVTLNAFHRGNRILIQVVDDGQGLIPEKLKKKAIERGIIDASEAERMTDHQALQLIWEPGFSTAEKITEISGRGMGMDIVRSKIEQLSGTVDLTSVPGQGTTITIRLPLTMAILPSLLTVIGGDVFAIPVESVSEIISVSQREICRVHGQVTARVRDRVISVVELDELFHWNTNRRSDSAVAEDKTLVVIGSDGNYLGLVVDRLIGEEEIVIKSLAENYRNVHGLAGASILGDGRVSLILDVTTILESVRGRGNSLA